MKLYIKQKVFSWGDKFTVKDATGNDRYFVEGEVFSFGKNCIFMILPRSNGPILSRNC
jgi:uncharacterized protein YxjI